MRRDGQRAVALLLAAIAVRSSAAGALDGGMSSARQLCTTSGFMPSAAAAHLMHDVRRAMSHANVIRPSRRRAASTWLRVTTGSGRIFSTRLSHPSRSAVATTSLASACVGSPSPSGRTFGRISAAFAQIRVGNQPKSTV